MVSDKVARFDMAEITLAMGTYMVVVATAAVEARSYALTWSRSVLFAILLLKMDRSKILCPGILTWVLQTESWSS